MPNACFRRVFSLGEKLQSGNIFAVNACMSWGKKSE